MAKAAGSAGHRQCEQTRDPRGTIPRTDPTARPTLPAVGLPLPRGAVGESFFEGDPHYQRLAQAFAWLASEPGIGVLTGEPGVGKTSAIRHLCRALPASEHRVVYLNQGPVFREYRMITAYTARRLRRWLMKKHKRRGTGYRQYPDEYLYERLGLYKPWV